MFHRKDIYVIMSCFTEKNIIQNFYFIFLLYYSACMMHMFKNMHIYMYLMYSVTICFSNSTSCWFVNNVTHTKIAATWCVSFMHLLVGSWNFMIVNGLVSGDGTPLTCKMCLFSVLTSSNITRLKIEVVKNLMLKILERWSRTGSLPS